jgi:hypothetical protein
MLTIDPLAREGKGCSQHLATSARLGALRTAEAALWGLGSVRRLNFEIAFGLLSSGPDCRIIEFAIVSQRVSRSFRTQEDRGPLGSDSVIRLCRLDVRFARKRTRLSDL